MSENAGREKKGRPSDTDDPILPEKKRARRRLVGALTLTLTAIIVLPMIFDPEPQTVSQNLLIDIPSRDKPPKTISKEQPKKKAEEVAAGTDKPPGDVVASDKKNAVTKTVENTPKDVASDGTKDKPAEADGKAGTKPAAKADAKTDAKADAKVDTKTDGTGKQEDPIELIAQKANTKKDEQEKQEKFVIQVAAVSTDGKAKELQNKLKTAGLNSYTQKVSLDDGGERIRIRIGPLSSKKEVNDTCAKLSKLKLPCTLAN